MALVFVGFSAGPRIALGQSLVEMYRSAQLREHAEAILKEHNGVSILPLDRVPYHDEELRTRMSDLFPVEEVEPEEVRQPAIEIRGWNLIPKLGRGWFEKEFENTNWSFLGSNAISPLDTTFTRELRARLEAKFGAPTLTVVELDHSTPLLDGEYIQFEYWFVLNDSIPVRVMDVNGPFERGLVLASSQKYRRLLPELKQAFLGDLVSDDDRAPYVDYYFLPEQRMWFRTGFDGRRYFLDRVSRPDLKLGRPLLERK